MSEEGSPTIPTSISEETSVLEDSATKLLSLSSLSASTTESEEEEDSEIAEMLIRISNVMEMIKKELLDIEKISEDGGSLHSATEKAIRMLQLQRQTSELREEINEM